MFSVGLERGEVFQDSASLTKQGIFPKVGIAVEQNL